MSFTSVAYNIYRGVDEMITCKLCCKDYLETDMSSNHKKMCKKCYADVTKYKRWQASTKKLTSHQEGIAARLEAMFDENAKLDRYVPECYTKPRRITNCVTCDREFLTSTNIRYCNHCRSRENSYRKLLHTHPTSPAVLEHELFYQEQRMMGRSVPTIFIGRYK